MNPIATAAKILVVVVGILGLSACDPNNGAPTVMDTPKIVWEPSAPSGGLNDDPYVRAASAAWLGYVLATNSGDFTISQLTDTNTAERIADAWGLYLAQHGDGNHDPIAYIGPFLQVPISVTEHPDGRGADVQVCDLSSEWYVSADHPDATIKGARSRTMTLEVVEDSGALKLNHVIVRDPGCDASGVAVGRFDPEPKPRPDGSPLRRPVSPNG